eukprot:TRINITY_DN73195_c0_g1_i1.p1 TRINITY_DN73195_c0_g1~~TRINITY_DN73195_c0_g1_i1.p1  ORF type:complete len:399 (+),score=73.83 TRINITY_DN73195_c0_g1_i1:66-1199(+)
MARYGLRSLCLLRLLLVAAADDSAELASRLVRREGTREPDAAAVHHARVSSHATALLEEGSQPELAGGVRRLPALLAEQQGCQNCCNDGERTVPCMDVHSCAASAPSTGLRFALVLTHIGTLQDRNVPHLGAMKAQVEKARAAGHQMDLLMLMKPGAIKRTDERTRELLKQHDVKFVPVDWTIPPDMRFTRPENWCGHQDLIRLHVLSLPGYDAVAYYDSDIKLQGDVLPVLRCASTGVFMTTSGGIGEPLNVGFFAVRPDQRLMKAAQLFAQKANYSVTEGWGASGYKPAGGYYVGAECGQGFFHTLFYKKSSEVAREALQEAGLGAPGVLLAAQIDMCPWNYQLSMFCKGFDCSQVQAHHKPTMKGSDPAECLKT